ncbi:MAG: alpha/beta hydrolase [Pseudomonadota bacterium]
MRVAPKTRAFFDRLKKEANENPTSPIDQIPIETLRSATIESFREYAGPLPEGVSASSFKNYFFKLSEENKTRAKIYTPERFDSRAGSTVIFFQGNGYIFNMLEAHLPGIARMANAANCQVIAIDTPLAPEHTAREINDMAYATVCYIFRNADNLDVNTDKLVLAGYSSGGNIVANIINRARTDSMMKFKHQLLLSPCLDLSLQTYLDNPYVDYQNKDEMVSLENLRYLMKQYYKNTDPRTPLISPMFASDLSGVPPTTIVLAEFDGVRGDGEMYAKRLEAFAVPVEVIICKGQAHSYFIARGMMDDDPDPAIVMAEAILKNSV